MIWECIRCGFQFEGPSKWKGGNPRKLCSDCRSVAKKEWDRKHYQRRQKSRRGPRYRKNDALKHRLRYHGYAHSYQGLTEQQWVDRWNERPDLYLSLIQAMERNAHRYPGHPRQYEHLWREEAA